eukprot:02233_4
MARGDVPLGHALSLNRRIGFGIVDSIGRISVDWDWSCLRVAGVWVVLWGWVLHKCYDNRGGVCAVRWVLRAVLVGVDVGLCTLSHRRVLSGKLASFVA